MTKYQGYHKSDIENCILYITNVISTS